MCHQKNMIPPRRQIDYGTFLITKGQANCGNGFEPLFMPDFLFDFQKLLADWAVRRGRCALLEDCGLGKTAQEFVWAENVVRKTNGKVIIFTPLAVAAQHIREAEKFSIEAYRSNDGTAQSNITITNYEQIHKFNPDDFQGVVCDEASILKNFDGTTRKSVTEFMRKIRYRLLGTATAAPNDYIELGTLSEALGELGYMDMLGRFFKNDQNTCKPIMLKLRGKTVIATAQNLEDRAKWRFKGHAEIPFWKWVASWARACRRPSDMGCDDGKFILPPLVEREHVIKVEKLAEGFLFQLPAVGLDEQRDERRRSIKERCEKVAELVASTKGQSLVWCHLNPEGDLLEKTIPDCQQISGSDSDESKEEKFIGFATGQIKNLVTKPRIGAYGLNLQNCAHVTFFPSHSWEQYYQGVRRCWRYGQKKKVVVDIVTTEGEQNVMRNLQRKAVAADKMFSELVKHMNQQINIEAQSKFEIEEELPVW